MLKNILKNFLWGNVGKYQIFFVTLQPNSEKSVNIGENRLMSVKMVNR